MKKFMALTLLVIMFMACDYAKESLEYKPDIEVVFMNPIGWYTSPFDTAVVAVIEEIKFVATNSVDCYLREVTWEYVDANYDTFYVGAPLALFAKIEGRVNPEEVDTTTIENLALPLQPARDHLGGDNAAARAYLHFVAESEYDPEQTDTCTAWFGIYLLD